MKQLLALKRGSKLVVVLYGVEYELILPEEEKVVSKSQSKRVATLKKSK